VSLREMGNRSTLFILAIAIISRTGNLCVLTAASLLELETLHRIASFVNSVSKMVYLLATT
jgi:hypothetical protein